MDGKTRRSTHSRRARGARGEALAARTLERAGYRVLEQNAHLRHAELDLVALDGSTLCFIEVRLRTGDRFGTAEESVDRRKQRRLARAARAWLATRQPPPHAALRFDVVAIDAGVTPPRVHLLRDAFHL
ncbi:MAG: YraN family protein [Myxococcota bacterium]